MRAALRDATLQLRTAQSDLAALQATQAAGAAEKKDLTEKYETVKKQAAADRAAAEHTTTGLGTQVADLKGQVAKLTEALAKAKEEGEAATKEGQALAESLDRLTIESNQLRRKVADREVKNLALFLLGNEILNRYENFSLGNALRAKEPFIGSMRAKLETIVQDYHDKLADQRIKQ